MVFSSIPIYPDPPNWSQQQVEASNATSQLPLQPPPPHGGGGSDGVGSTRSIRPGSMTERARIANIPQPEAALKCPRCESTNTKFCYYNNYNLSQPRHFCKACKRYWTRGGALRNVPVGGGSRRNKRSKSNSKSRTKSPSKAGGCSSSRNELVPNGCTNDILRLMVPPPLQVPMLPPLQSLGEYNSTDFGLNFTRIQPPSMTVNGGGGMEFHIGTSSSSSGGGAGSILSSRLVDQLRFQQFPPLANLEFPSGGLSSLEVPGIDHQTQNYIGAHKSKQLEAGVTQVANVKMEENQGLNLARNYLGVYGNDQQYWGSNAWSDLAGFAPNSTSHLL